MTSWLALDPGFGNVKLFGERGSLVMQSAIATGDAHRTARIRGLRATKQALRVKTTSGSFFVGQGAHDWGRPIENLDFDRFRGTPEMMALLYGALTQFGATGDNISLIVGLPVSVSLGDDAPHTKRALRLALVGEHAWNSYDAHYTCTIDRVSITSQPVGAMFDFLLDEEGGFVASRRNLMQSEIGIIGVGMNTVDLLVARNGALVSRFTSGETSGVRRLLELAQPSADYSLAELDAQLRANSLNLDEAQSVWERDVLGIMEKRWGKALNRFGVVVAVGGGVRLMRTTLLRRLRDKLYVPDDPIIATVRGLHKFALMSERRHG